MELANYWKVVADTMRDGLLVVDDQGTIVDVNPAVVQMTGYSRDELVGHNCTLLNCTGCEIFRQGRGQRWCSLFRMGKVRAKQCYISTRQGERISVLKQASVLKDAAGGTIGAVEILTDVSELYRKEQEVISLRRALDREEGVRSLFGKSPVMQRLVALLENVAHSEAPVLIEGESGVGKELAALAIHELGPRREGPYVKVNCAALNDTLLESELFGHAKGAFAGADRNRVGAFEAASGGSILLDEVGDLPLGSQAKLIRVLENKEIERMGEEHPIRVDARILATSNQSLAELVGDKRFREDLYYRLNVMPVYVPALRERVEDIPLLVHNFLAGQVKGSDAHVKGVDPLAMEILMAYPWPGNVRELHNALEYALVLSAGRQIEPGHLPPRIAAGEPSPGGSGPFASDPVKSQQRQELIRALRAAKGNQTQAAEILGVSRVTIWNRMKRLGVDLQRDIIESF